MKNLFAKPYRWAAFMSVLLTCSLTFVLLDTFVISKAVTEVKTEDSAGTQGTSPVQTQAVETASAYEDENIKINIETVRKYETTFYVADIRLADAACLQTALAENTYGRNIKETTSEIAAAHKAIFAVNGDYYGFRNAGYVLRNGVLYRDTPRAAGEDEALLMDKEGNFSVISESQVSAQSLFSDEAWQVLSFGPSLVKQGQVTVDSQSEVGQSQSSNPRTAIGQVSEFHYMVIVSDGRTNESKGLSLLELAQEFAERGCSIAYNLDGGGSSTMYFNGKIINKPTDGRNSGEREVSDIVYIGY